MIEKQKARVEEAIAQVVEDINKTHLRELQAKMFRCAAQCCDDKYSSVSSVQSCVMNCGSDLQNSQKYVEGEIGHVLDRLQRCIMTCNDSIRDKMGARPSESESRKYTAEFESCASKCVDSHMDLIPNLLDRFREYFTKKNFESLH